jgi:transglutaminase-like putative cysteine protease
MSVDAESYNRAGGRWTLDLLLWLLLALMLLPAVVSLRALPWSQHLADWAVPGAAAIGATLGILLTLVSLPTRWWWTSLSAAPILGGAVALGALLGSHGASGASDGAQTAGAIMLAAYTAVLVAALPWLALRARQAWLAVVLVWITLAGAWGTHLSTQQVWWLISLLALSLTFLGLTHLRQEVRTWNNLRLERLGPVVWPSARAVVLMSLLIALVGLVPLGATQLAALSRAWRYSVLGQGGPLSYDSPEGTPVAVLGAPLRLNAPDVTGDRVVLSYTILTSLSRPIPPPLLGATLDTFDGQAWRQGSQTVTTPTGSALDLPTGAQLLRAEVTVGALPQSDHGTLLLGFEQPLYFSVPTRTRVIADGTPSIVTIAGWESPKALARASTYTTESAVIPEDATGSGTLPPALISDMTQTPPNLTAELQATARAWMGKGSATLTAQTPTALGHALLDAFTSQVKIDPRATPAAGVDPVSWLLQNKRGNVLLVTTAYILLGRSLGLPLRLAEGYLPGTPDPKTHRTIVRASDATVWAQLAIPGMGWMDLFPASNTVTNTVHTKIIYSGTPVPTATPKPTPPPNQPNSGGGAGSRGGVFGGDAGQRSALIGGAIVLLLLALVGVVAALAWRWSRFGAELPPLARFFARIGLLAKLAGVRLRASDTAAQATAKVTVYVPEQAETLIRLNSAYEQMRYGPPAGQTLATALATLGAHWRQLRATFVRLIVTRPWRRPRA